MDKKILIVAESIDVEDSSGTKGRVALIKNLKQIGFNVKVFHYTRKDIQLEEIPCKAIKENRNSFLFYLSRFERLLRLKLKLDFHIPLEKLFGFSFTLYNDRNSIIDELKGSEELDSDLIITLSKGGSFRPHHALLKMPELHHKWLAYIHDPYPAHLYPRPFAWVEAGYFQKWKFIHDISKNAAYSAFPSKLLMEWMGSYFPNFLKTGYIIPHQLFDSKTEGIELPEFFNPDNFNLLHAGTLLDPRNPKSLVRAFEKFLKRNSNARGHSKLIFLGGKNVFSSWLEDYEKHLKELKVSESYISFDKVRKMQQNAAVNIILEAKSEISPFLPGKFPHCVQADKPILLLGPKLSESKRLLGEDYRYWSEIDDEDKIADIIESLYLNWKNYQGTEGLNRTDLINYLSTPYLREVLGKIQSSQP
ncbi:UDP-glycosyltransferase [Christiangramia sp. SM2212]|uniref:UDP-glycosyltransferase n=1 Tax=Christiangramia sediminicola TaxID=3073267 RepID=A0ABU1EMV1_9FLAO|nr:UDP-glycosyltransferase [Christiangramia sp. SM2212]MDR5589709.1 UDP-glycosyltransferase [Christiangramia sp. SM2212]